MLIEEDTLSCYQLDLRLKLPTVATSDPEQCTLIYTIKLLLQQSVDVVIHYTLRLHTLIKLKPLTGLVSRILFVDGPQISLQN